MLREEVLPTYNWMKSRALSVSWMDIPELRRGAAGFEYTIGNKGMISCDSVVCEVRSYLPTGATQVTASLPYLSKTCLHQDDIEEFMTITMSL